MQSLALISAHPPADRKHSMVCHNLLFPQAVCQCRQKNYRQLDIFPARDAYHPMSEYPTYHTHGRYVPAGGTNRSPYEEVRLGPTGRGRQRLWLGKGSEGGTWKTQRAWKR